MDLLDLEDGKRARMGHARLAGQWTLPTAFDSETVSKPVPVLNRVRNSTRPNMNEERGREMWPCNEFDDQFCTE